MDKNAEKNLAGTRKQAAEETAERVEANSALKAPTAAEQAKAQKEGAQEAIKEAAKDTYKYLTDGNLASDTPGKTWLGYDDIQQWEPLLRQEVEAFEAAIAEDAAVPVPEEKVYGLLALERNGQNRTPYVRAAMKRLGLKSNELPGGGPAYTNDVSPISKLD